MLTIEQLSAGYRQRRGQTAIVANVNLSLTAGDLVCVLGPNGAGKSTLMRTLAAMQPPLEGRVMLDGHDLHALAPRARARKLGVVLTERVTAGLLTARELVALGRYPHTGWSGRLRTEDHQQIELALHRVGATGLAERFVMELSDGERQRIMLARALAQEPALLILDEITAFLDLPGRIAIMHLLRTLAREARCAILVSTHDFDLALQVADGIWLVPGTGNVQAGGPEDLALAGAFDQLYDDPALVFDQLRGAFRICERESATVALIGRDDQDPLLLAWTERLVHRVGLNLWRVGDAPPSYRLRLPGEEEPCWRLERDGVSGTAVSLQELAALLRS